MGPLMLDLAGCEITAEESEIVNHPLVGGVILFSRNYYDQAQLTHLVAQIRLAAKRKDKDDLLIAVDHEGGRVQRFRQGFSAIPAMAEIMQVANDDLARGCDIAKQLGWLMAAELRAVDIDISFAPVLDIRGVSTVIAERSFHQHVEQLVPLASHFIQGMHQAGMKATGKHFPGHGNVKEDSHIAMPVDRRSAEQILSLDMQVFAQINQQGLLDAVMPAHVIYPAVDDKPAGFSKVWLQDYLRKQMGFRGVIFSDDLSMQGAAYFGDFSLRARAALDAGCDMVLVCNNPTAAVSLLDDLPSNGYQSTRAITLRGGSRQSRQQLSRLTLYRQTQQTLKLFSPQ